MKKTIGMVLLYILAFVIIVAAVFCAPAWTVFVAIMLGAPVRAVHIDDDSKCYRENYHVRCDD